MKALCQTNLIINIKTNGKHEAIVGTFKPFAYSLINIENDTQYPIINTFSLIIILLSFYLVY